MANEKPSAIEQHTIYPIPHDQRHGTFRDLFTIWFGSNIMMLTIVTGALATTVFKLDFVSSIWGSSTSQVEWKTSSMALMGAPSR